MRESLHEVYQALKSCESLRPSPVVNSLFGRLVRLVLACPPARAAELLGDPRIRSLQPHLHDLCARGEQELEFAWARRIATSPEPHDELAAFPYLTNYRRLCRMEVDLLGHALDGAALQAVAFIGAGPLPLSAMMLAEQLGVPVDGLDRDPRAVASARDVVRALGTTGLRFRNVDACATDVARFDLVVLAALAGTSVSEKRRIISHLASSMAPGTLFLARSAHGIRTLLYPAIDHGALDGFDLLATEHPYGEVINSAILARVPDSGERPATEASRR